MTLSPAFEGFVTAALPVPSLWIASRPLQATFNEGATVRFRLQCINATPGVSKMVWKLVGSKASVSNWSMAWPEAWNAAMKGRGMKYTPLSANTYSATIAGLIEIEEGYDGQPVDLFITCIENRRSDVLNGNPGTLQVTIQLELYQGATGTLQGSGSPFFINDTSKTPAGTPTYRPQIVQADGSAGSPTVNEGDTFYIQINTENMIPGTQFLLAAVNQGQSAIEGGFQAAIKAAAIEAGCLCSTAYSDRGNYNGGVVTFTEAYDDAKPIRIPIVIKKDFKTTGRRQLDFLTMWRAEGDPALATVRYGGTLTLQINDSSVEPTPSYWRLSARVSGTTLAYALASPTGSSDASVTLSSSGIKPAGFDASIAAAIANTPGISMVGDVITSTPAWGGELVWQVPLPAGSGKHALRLTNTTADSRIQVGDACVFFQPPNVPTNPAYVTGVNLSGGEFGSKETNRYRTDYRYPADPDLANIALRYAGIDYHLGKGSQILRLPVRMERIQRDGFFTPLSGELPLGKTLDRGTPYDIARIDDIVRYVTGQGRIVILDLHNYMDYSGVGKIAYGMEVPIEALLDVWERLANRYADNPLVWFGTMNEPNGLGQSTTNVRDAMEWLTNAIRGRTPALNRILWAGAAWTGAWSWVSSGNAAAFVGLRDPADNALIELHQYFDDGKKGQSGVCVANSNTLIQPPTVWARQNGYRLFMGEMAGGDPAVPGQEQCGSVVPAALNYMVANRDVWAGCTVWGGGPVWKETYEFRLDQLSGVDTPQMLMIQPYLTKIA